jgi:hypothetical protein
MHRRDPFPQIAPRVTIRVSGKLFHGHLAYLDQLVQSAKECRLWPLLNLSNLEELDRAALSYLIQGENREFGIVACPNLIQESMALARNQDAA